MLSKLLKASAFASPIAKRNSSTFARLTVLGRIGQDPTVEKTGEKEFVKYSIATSGTKDGPPSWWNIAVFNDKQKEFTTNYAKKGSLVYVTGNITNQRYEKADGAAGYAVNIYQTSIDIIRNPYNPEGAVEEE